MGSAPGVDSVDRSASLALSVESLSVCDFARQTEKMHSKSTII
jgi:hypothetical protein